LDGVIARAIANNYHSLLVDAYKLAAALAIKKGELTAALKYIDAGVAQAQQNKERADEALLEKLRVDVFIQQHAIPAALTALQHQNKLNDEIYNSKRAAAIASIQTQVDFTRQQHQLELLQKEQVLQQAMLEQHRLSRNFWIFGLVAAFAILLMLYRRFHQHRLNQQLAQQVATRTEELYLKNQELQTAYQQLESISLTDKLTGLNNRHFLENQIENELEHCLRLYQDWQSGKTAKPENADLVVFLIDLDNFKMLNDSYGHDVGDEVLKQLKHKMQQVFRQSDYLVRWGGEEFVAVARFIDREDAKNLAQRFVEIVQQDPFQVEGHSPLSITCSVGYVCYPLTLGERACQWSTLLKLADLCLYAAKYSGRNGWVGLQNYAVEMPIPSQTISALQMRQWSDQGFIQIHHSFDGPLHWQKPVEH
jgi:two-component system, cell cycle response regulator